MMATEAAFGNSVDASVPSESKLANHADYDAHNVDHERAHLNGSPAVDDIENKRITSVEDQVNSADVSVSGGSDTEASRADLFGGRDGEKGHGRTSSTVKKPATFKAVSVNKTFLAAKGSSNILGSKLGEKASAASGLATAQPGASALSASRPRLVAKTGSGIRDSVPRFSAVTNGGKASAGPDPSAVWNKNRPVPVPEPRKFTDEELKKYGIHMASRLAPESAQAQGNWADIDDDDEDWAPETITWTDGTKVTLPQADEPPPPIPEPVPEPIPEPIPVIPKDRLYEKPKSPAPPYTASPTTKSGSLASGKGLILKPGSADKPTLVAKPPAPPTPVKSPWAPLPPIEKAPPVVLDNPASQLNSRQPVRDQAMNNMTPLPTKEIAADDFSRSSWRDGSTGTNRELYNSQSGRYEPVPDRRGSIRNEAHNRQPALLQRPSQQDHPEPSAAFQTNRTVQEGPFGRRRGSSNVSGGSGTYFQRPLKGLEQAPPPAELLNARRGSMAGSMDSPISPRNFSPSGQQGGPRPHHNQPIPPRPSPGTNFANLQPAGTHPDAQMAPPAPVARLEDDLELQKKIMRERREMAMQRRREEEAREEAERRERIKAKLDAMGPPPERKSTKRESSTEEDPTQVQLQQQDGSTGPDATSQSREPGSDMHPSLPVVGANISNSYNANERVNVPASSDQGRKPGVQEAKQPWEAATTGQPERFPTWATTPQPSLRNVWGSPNNDRGLGNGTFDPDLGRLPDPQTGQIAQPQVKKGPAPIAPPNVNPQRLPNPPARQGQGRPTARPPREFNELQNKWVNSVLAGDKMILEEKKERRTERDRDLAERGLTIESAQAPIKDTWRAVSTPGDAVRDAGAHIVIRHDAPKVPMDASNNEYPPSSLGSNGALSGPPAPSIIPPTGSSASQARPSRFFPPKDIRMDSHTSVKPERPNSPSPPPPTMVGHPAYDGDALHPHVSLPRPQPVVRLPPAPAAAAPVPTSKTGPSFSWANPTPYKDGVNPSPSPNRTNQPHHNTSQRAQDQPVNENWQDRINNLLTGRKATSPPKASVVEPASRSVLDQAAHHYAATVSLPPAMSQPQMSGDLSSFTSKSMAEECFEEQEMGSLPQIRLPNKVPDTAWEPVMVQTKPLPRKFWVTETTSVGPFWIPHDISGTGNVIRVHFPGMLDVKMITIPFTRSRSNPRRGSGRGTPRGSSTGHRGGKPRDPSTSYSADTTGSVLPTRGGRGGFRGGRTDNWTRHASASQAA